MTAEERDNERFDREYSGKPNPWVPDPSDLEELESGDPVMSVKIAALQDLTRVLRES